jgi:hypothetical protein
MLDYKLIFGRENKNFQKKRKNFLFVFNSGKFEADGGWKFNQLVIRPILY